MSGETGVRRAARVSTMIVSPARAASEYQPSRTATVRLRPLIVSGASGATEKASGVAGATPPVRATTVNCAGVLHATGEVVASVGRARRNQVPTSVIVTGTVVAPAADVKLITPELNVLSLLAWTS